MRRLLQTISLLCATALSTTHAEIPNYTNLNAQERLELLSTPISFGPHCFNEFMQNVYNQYEYASVVLPNSMHHLLQFFEYGTTYRQPRSYYKSVVKLFHNKIKASEYINPYAFSDMLEKINPLLRNQMVSHESHSWHKISSDINEILYHSFVSNFPLFKASPKTFLSDLSESIVQRFQKSADEEIEIAHLQASMLRFFEISIGKLVWSPEDKEKSWHLVKKIADQLAELLEADIIANVDDLDDIYWSLVHRYCFYLDVAQTNLAPETFAYIRTDIESNPCVLFSLEEQEPFITSKKQHLLAALLDYEAKGLARERGFVVR